MVSTAVPTRRSSDFHDRQGGSLLEERTFYGFDGLEIRERDGVTYAGPILGTQFGFSNDQGDGTVGDLRAEVDADMDPVYQDELILGFQQQLSTAWSWGVRGIYRKLNNAIDDINITATHCGRVASNWVMANPGEDEIGRAACRERGLQYGVISGGAGTIKKKK